MPRTCTVCTHPRRVEIDRALVAGGSNRVIARQYGVSHDAVRRHRRHLSAKLTKAAAARVDREALSLVDQMEAHLATAKAVLDRVVPQQGRVRAFEAAAALREVREALMAIARLTGQFRDSQVNIVLTQHPDWLALQERLITALRPFPEARAAVIAALSPPA